MLFIVGLCVQNLVLLQINDLREVKQSFNYIKIELTKNGVVVLQAQVRHIYLNFFRHWFCWVISKLLSNFKEAFFNFFLNPWFKLLLHIVQLKVLAFKILQNLVLLVFECISVKYCFTWILINSR